MGTKRQLGSRGQPELSQRAILASALGEFSASGVAGARIDAIAEAAHVNKALIYYYFGDKERLYGAVLDSVFEPLVARLTEVLDRDLPVGEKMMAYVGAHFDYVATHNQYPRVVQHELMRAGGGTSPHLQRIVTRYFRPVFARVAAVLAQGIREGVFRSVEPRHFVMSTVAVIVFYFSSTPIARSFSNAEPLAPVALRARRTAVLDFIAAALFADRGEAERVLLLPHVVTPAPAVSPRLSRADGGTDQLRKPNEELSARRRRK